MITVVINGQNYNYPEVGDTDWGSIATLAFDAITKTTLQPVKDLNDPSVVNDFTLYNDIDFGPTHGLRVVFIQSRSNNPAATGVFRLAKDELVAWRNEDNDGDNTISFDSDGDLIVNGVKVTLHGQIVNDDIAAAAGIEESKLALDHSTQSLYENIEDHKSDTDNPHSTSISNLSDVNLSASNSGDSLIYDADSGTWFNQLNSLENLIDTGLTSVTNGDALVYDGALWSNRENSVDNLSNVNVSSPTDDDIIVYDSNSANWINKANSVENLKDANVSSVADGDILQYDSNDSEWKNSDALSTLDSTVSSHVGNTSNPHSTSITNLTDTTITSASSGDVLSYDGSKWVNSPSTSSSLSGLSDTDITTPADGDVLVYDSVSTKWENSDQLSTLDSTVSTHVGNTSNPHSTSVSNLTDTNVSSLNDSDILIYDSDDAEWKNTQYSLKRLVDTAISSEASGDALVYDGNDWINQANSVDNLSNVTVSSVTDGDVLVYDSNSADWINQANTVSNLTDTTISSVSDKDTLLYDSNSSKWKNVENSIDNLSNVDIDSNTETENDVLVFNDQTLKWENSQIMVNHIGNTANPHLTTVAKLTDTAITTPADKDILSYDNVNSIWINRSNSVSSLSDATITTPSDKQLLQYDYANSKWVNSSDVWSRIEFNDMAQIRSTTGNFTVTSSMPHEQIITHDTPCTITVSDPNIKAGEKFRFRCLNLGANQTTPFYIKTANGETLINWYCPYYVIRDIVAKVDNPQSASDWSAIFQLRSMYHTGKETTFTNVGSTVQVSSTLFSLPYWGYYLITVDWGRSKTPNSSGHFGIDVIDQNNNIYYPVSGGKSVYVENLGQQASWMSSDYTRISNSYMIRIKSTSTQYGIRLAVNSGGGTVTNVDARVNAIMIGAQT